MHIESDIKKANVENIIIGMEQTHFYFRVSFNV